MQHRLIKIKRICYLFLCKLIREVLFYKNSADTSSEDDPLP